MPANLCLTGMLIVRAGWRWAHLQLGADVSRQLLILHPVRGKQLLAQQMLQPLLTCQALCSLLEHNATRETTCSGCMLHRVPCKSLACRNISVQRA